MNSKPNPAIALSDECIDSFLASSFWQRIVSTLALPPQEARIVSLLLRGKQDKEIVAAMRLSRDTIRTYLRRVFDRLGVDDRAGVVRRVFGLSLNGRPDAGVTLLCDTQDSAFSMLAVG